MPVTRLTRSIVLLLLSTQCAAADGFVDTAAERSNPFATAMDMMMDAMDNYSRKRQWDQALSSYGTSMQPWALGAMPGMTPQMPGQTQMQQMFQNAPGVSRAMGNMGSPMGAFRQPRTMAPFYSAPTQQTGSAIDGVWQGSSGEVFVVRNGYCRIYASREAYDDCRIAVQGQMVTLVSPTSRQRRQYEYAVSDGRMVLRDSDGNLLLYRRLPDTAARALLN